MNLENTKPLLVKVLAQFVPLGNGQQSVLYRAQTVQAAPSWLTLLLLQCTTTPCLIVLSAVQENIVVLVLAHAAVVQQALSSETWGNRYHDMTAYQIAVSVLKENILHPGVPCA